MDYFSSFRDEIKYILQCGWRVKGKNKNSLTLLYRNGMEITIKYFNGRYILEGYLLSSEQVNVDILTKTEQDLYISKLHFDARSWGYGIIACTEIHEDISGDEFLNRIGHFTYDLSLLAGDLEK